MTPPDLWPDRADLIARYDANTPRYTSYPTAAQFTAAVGPADWSAALARGPWDRPASLYVHIPFCKRLCWYCGCNTRAMNRVDAMADYVDLVLQEADRVVAAAGATPRIGMLHLGGGTPNMLPPDLLARLVQGLSQRFDLSALTEFAAELDPEVLTLEWITAAGDLGLTRASLGVQDLSPVVQAAVNRPERFETIQDAAERLRAAGVFSLNLDLMYGLPHQGVEQVLATIDRVTTLRPDRLALFGYAHVPWMKPHQKLIDETALGGPLERFAMSRAAHDRLTALGYRAIGLDHFALPHDDMAAAARAGRLRRNFQGYTTDQAEVLIGLGASSVSRAPGLYVQNITGERDWRTAMAAGGLPVARGVVLTGRDRFVAEIIARLMCDFAVDVEAVARDAGRPLRETAEAWPRLDAFEADGLIVQEGARIAVTQRGRPFVRAVAAAFDPALNPATDRHARVV